MGQTATNPQTGEKLQWNGRAWVPVEREITATNPQTGEKMTYKSGRWIRADPLQMIPRDPAQDTPGKLMYPINEAMAGIAGLPNVIAQKMQDVPVSPVMTPGRVAANKQQGEYLQQHTYSPEEISGGITSITGIEPKRAESGGGRIVQDVASGAIQAAPAMAFGAPPGSTLLLGGLGGGTAGALREAGAPESVQIIAGALLPLVGFKVGGFLLRSTPTELLSKALKAGATKAEFEAATQMMQRPNPPTFAEAINQVTKGKFPQLLSYQRVAERTPGGQEVLGPFMAKRLDQNVAEIQKQVGALPAGQAALDVPFNVQTGAKGVVSDAVGNLRSTTRPLYQAASASKISPDQMNGLIADLDKAIATTGSDSVRSTLMQFRKDLIDTPATPAKTDPMAALTQSAPVAAQAEMPVMDIGRLDSIRKAWRDKIELPDPSINAGAVDKEAAAKIGPVLSKLRSYMEGASKAYKDARSAHATGMRTVIEPLQRGPVGQIAEGTPTLQTQRNALGLTSRTETPQALSPDQVGQTVRAIAGKDRASTSNLLGQVMTEDLQNTIARKRPGYGLQQAASDWRYRLFGSEGSIAEKRWQAAVENASVDGPRRWKGFKTMLETLDAQGQRLPAGSNTMADTQAAQDLSQSRLPLMPSQYNVLSAQSRLSQWWEDFTYGRNTRQMAQLLTSNKNADYWAALAKVKPGSPAALRLTAALLGSQAAAQPQ